MSSYAPDDPLLARLRAGAASSLELQQALDQSQSSVSRRLRALISRNEIIRIGARRGARYALPRLVQGIGAQWPLRRVDVHGNIQELGVLHALAADEYYFETSTDTKTFASTGVTSGLPYFLQDQRPGGFLGRAVPQRYPELALPQRVIDWTDDHYLRYLTQCGSDTLGDLILGDPSLDQYLASQRHRSVTPADDRETRYPRLADEVMQGGLPGSSAHGEHPKFAALIKDETGPRHVLVKFSPTIDTSVGQRWSDLLVAEHVAHSVLSDAGVLAASSRIDHVAGRTFMEVARFDRTGIDGRIGISSLLAVDTALYGALDSWIAAALRLHRDHRIDASTLETVRLVATFGALIANTDRHFGNLSFFDRYDGKFTLAPVYDMLPMLFAPEYDQITARTFEATHPTSETLHVYGRARTLAEGYWRRLAQDGRITPEFRGISAACAETLERLPRAGAYIGGDQRTGPNEL